MAILLQTMPSVSQQFYSVNNRLMAIFNTNYTVSFTEVLFSKPQVNEYFITNYAVSFTVFIFSKQHVNYHFITDYVASFTAILFSKSAFYDSKLMFFFITSMCLKVRVSFN